MAEKLNLNAIKSSGVYTIEIDESSNLSLPISTGRLVIGSSKKGPINSIVLVNDSRTNTAVYGDIDTKLEKNGSYFHRTIGVALRQGPVFALNVLPVQDSDLAYFRTFNSESASNNSTWAANTNNSSIANFYNTQKLWFADGDMVSKWKNIELGDDYILNPGTYGEADRDANKILTVVNLSRKDITTWVRIGEVSGYDLTVKEYYRLLGDKVEVPEFLNADDIVQDYFIEVIAVEGDWSNHIKLANDPVYKQYFTTAGIIDSKLNDFISLREVTLIAKSQGCIIPEFKDLTGTIVAIDTVFNRNFPQTGVYIALDHKKIDLMDLTEATFTSGSTTEPIAQQRLDLVGYGVDELNTTDLLSTLYTVDDGSYYTGSSGTGGSAPVALIDTLSYKKPVDSTFNFKTVTYTGVYAEGETYLNDNDYDYNVITATKGSKLYQAWASGFVKPGDRITGSVGEYYLGIDNLIKTQTGTGVDYIDIHVYQDVTRVNEIGAETILIGTDSYFVIYYNTVDQYANNFDLTDTDYFTSYQYTAPNKLVFEIHPALYGNYTKNETSNALAGYPYDAALRSEIDSFFKVGQYLKANVISGTERNRMLQIKSVYAQKISVNYGPSLTPVTVLKYTVTTNSPIDLNNQGILLDYTNGVVVRAYKGIKKFITSLVGYTVPSMLMDDLTLYPNGTAARQESILQFMFDGCNLASTLSNNETIDYRYLIDSYEGQIYPGGKQQLAQLAADHGQLLAIVNSPSFAQYERSVDPSFIDMTTRLVSPLAISTGGDLNSNPAFLSTFAQGEKNGIALSTYTAYFMPNIVIYESGKNKSIPPAMYAANAFMKKYTSGNTFSIVAGKRGILSDPEIVGLEYDLTDSDRDYLEPAGFNLIVRRRGFGVMIYSNNTGYQRVKSALNNTHVREALVTVERDIERILLNFLFDWNDVTTRMRVKTIVKNYLSAVQDARGISSFEVIFDDSNNGVEVLSNNAGVVDIIVNFPRGIHKFINRITITQADGSLSSSSTGFTPSF
jgi:hypothetical protein